MDDPLVALTFWQSHDQEQANNKTKRKKKKKDRSSRIKDKEEKEQISNGALNEEDGLIPPTGAEARESRSPPGSDDLCFPCLPGLDDEPKPAGREKGDEKKRSELDPVAMGSPVPEPQDYWLMRLFQSNLFDMSIAIGYLFNAKEPDVQAYLCQKLFSFDASDVDFYLPQLITMYIHIDKLSTGLHKYFLYRARTSVLFSLQLAWLLTSITSDSCLTSTALQRAASLLRLIRTEQIRSPPPLFLSAAAATCSSSSEKQHHRSLSATPVALSPSSQLTAWQYPLGTSGGLGNMASLGDLHSGRAFDTGCTCVLPGSPSLTSSTSSITSTTSSSTTSTVLSMRHCVCQAPRLVAQDIFVHCLGKISNKLLKHSTRRLRTAQLYAELSQLNLNLPARVCLPLYPATHQVLRVPTAEAVVLNSKSKAPYLILVEVSECEDTFLSPLPSKQLDYSVTSSGLSSDMARVCVRSEGPSPSATRASSMPNLHYSSADNLPSLQSTVQEEEEPDNTEGIVPTTAEYKNKAEKAESEEDEKKADLETPTFSVGDIRRRLTQELEAPPKMSIRDPEDPSAIAMKELWEEKVRRIKESSPYSHLPTWRVLAAIVKWGDDLRQEMLCSQLLEQFRIVWRDENVPLWIRPYTVMVISSDGGLIEPVHNTISLHQIKRQHGCSLFDYFKKEFGDTDSELFLSAQKNFVESCAAYCLLCYFIQIKDRHNGNILMDNLGHVIHIDFGFILAHSPGKNIRFESSPFKLTPEFTEVMGGVNSDMYGYFKYLMLKGFMAARKYMDKFVQIVEISQTGSQLHCYGHGPTTVKQLRDRFHMTLTETQLEVLVNSMIDSSMNSITTKLYDQFQYLTNGIL